MVVCVCVCAPLALCCVVGHAALLLLPRWFLLLCPETKTIEKDPLEASRMRNPLLDAFKSKFSSNRETETKTIIFI